MPDGTPLERTDLSMRALEEVLYEFGEIESMVTTVGALNSFSGEGGSGGRYANALILLPEDRKRASQKIVADIRAKMTDFSDGTVRVGEPQGGPPTGAPVLIKFLGENGEDLERVAGEAKAILQDLEGTADIETSGENDGIEFSLRVDKAKLSELGLTPAVVAQTLRTAIYGTEATSIQTDGNDIDVIVRANLNTESNNPSTVTDATLDAVRQIPIATQNGEVLLGSLVEPSLTKASASISHEGRRRIVSVTSDIEEGTNLRKLIAAFEKQAEEKIVLPSGITMQIGGENEETNKSFMEMFFAFIAGIVLMYVVVVLEFNSFRLAAYTLLTVPLSLIGVLIGLTLTGRALSFPSLLGLIALGGVIINHSIILIDSFVSPLRKHEGEDSFEDRVVKAASSRLRPIILTTATTVIGMVPLSLAADIWAPLAYTIMFGLVFATILTLVMIPLLLYRNPGKAIREMIDKA
jgi:hydrophobic/amphiphilic exporter-1 (mainly G- bacteria), HAE1 family